MASQLNHSVQRGFTLIELIMVIVILGILSAFALPKFADFSSDAESSSLEGARGAVRSAAAISHAACLAASTCDASAATSTVSIEGTSIAMVYGYPSVVGIQDAASLDGYTIDTGGVPDLIIAVGGDGTPCFTYNIATGANDAPDIGSALTYAVDSGNSNNNDCTP